MACWRPVCGGHKPCSDSCLMLQLQRACCSTLDMRQQPKEVLLSRLGDCYLGTRRSAGPDLWGVLLRERCAPWAHHGGVAHFQTWCQCAATSQEWAHTELPQCRRCPSKTTRHRAHQRQPLASALHDAQSVRALHLKHGLRVVLLADMPHERKRHGCGPPR